MRALTRPDHLLLPTINADDPASMMLWPDWLTSLRNAVSVGQEGETTWSRTPMIPESLMPTLRERGAIEARLVELDELQRPGPEKALLGVVSEIIAFYATGSSSAAQTALQANIWLEALSDLPAWAVVEAKRRWFRGEVRQSNGFKPEPADIRRVAEHVSRVARGQSVLLQRILNAKALPPPVPPDRRAEVVAIIEGAITGLAGRDRKPESRPDLPEGQSA